MKIKIKNAVERFRTVMEFLNKDLYSIENRGIVYNKTTAVHQLKEIAELVEKTISLEEDIKKTLLLRESEAVGSNKYREVLRRLIRQTIDMRKHLYEIADGLIDRQIQVVKRAAIEWNK